MADIRTIDNLGVSSSERYARDQAILDQSFVKDAAAVSRQTTTDVMLPSYSSFDTVFEMNKRNLPWADFFTPIKYTENRSGVFSHQLFPWLGSFEMQEIKKENMRSYATSKKAKRKGSPLGWEEAQEEKEEMEELHFLMRLIDSIQAIDKNIQMVLSKKGQYQKG